MGLRQSIERLRTEIAAAAQGVIDAWVQDEDGFDEELGGGGPCDAMAREIASVLSSIDGVEIVDGGQDGDDHAFIIVHDDKDAFGVDVPPGVYETGSGYSWKKIEGVKVRPEDVAVWKVDRDLVVGW